MGDIIRKTARAVPKSSLISPGIVPDGVGQGLRRLLLEVLVQDRAGAAYQELTFVLALADITDVLQAVRAGLDQEAAV